MWLQSILARIPIFGHLRQHVALLEAENRKLITENTNLKSQVAALQTQLDVSRLSLKEEKEEHQKLKGKHAEDVQYLNGVEFRRGLVTARKWQAFCPGCHTVLYSFGSSHFEEKVICPSGCGWSSTITAQDICKILNRSNGDEK